MKERENFAKLLFPINLPFDLLYTIPQRLVGKVAVGNFVKLPFRGGERIGVVESIGTYESNIDPAIEYKEIGEVLEIPPLTSVQMAMIVWISKYYLCTKGEALKGSVGQLRKIEELLPITPKLEKSGKEELSNTITTAQKETLLSEDQESAYRSLIKHLEKRRVTLLRGVTGSGKSEIFLKLAKEYLNRGESVLYMVPEIALSREFSKRLKSFFGREAVIYHSAIGLKKRREIRSRLRMGKEPMVILGLRSALFLPFSNLGLIIVDEEHDPSYKQSEPAPRYHGRDVAVMLASHFNAAVVMGSATPSLETLYNCYTKKYGIVELSNNYYKRAPGRVEIVNTSIERERKGMVSIFAKRSLELIQESVERGRQVLVFRNRRSYSPMVQCMYCGDIPHCTRCNVALNYHKRESLLSCHYCSFKESYLTICKKCGKPGVRDRGSGIEKIEESLRSLFPNYRVERFDGQIGSSKRESERVLGQFAKGEIDILVGTQVLSKGFDFEKLSLIVVIEADSLLSVEDFRASERALQLLKQLMGRAGRREEAGVMVIQSGQPNNPIYQNFLKGEESVRQELAERKEFNFPPFVRMIKIAIKESNRGRLVKYGEEVGKLLIAMGIEDFSGPVAPLVERVDGKYIFNFWIKLDREMPVATIKERLYTQIKALHQKMGRGALLSFDVDPQ
ncbi:MAG: primosomal protein N' [Bacteroidales bacterium]